MLNFVYDNKTTLIFGKGTQHEAGALLKPFGKKVLLHYGGGSIRAFRPLRRRHGFPESRRRGV